LKYEHKLGPQVSQEFHLVKKKKKLQSGYVSKQAFRKKNLIK